MCSCLPPPPILPAVAARARSSAHHLMDRDAAEPKLSREPEPHVRFKRVVGGTGLEPVTPTVSWRFQQVQRTGFESTDVSGSLISSPPFERHLRDQGRGTVTRIFLLADPFQPTHNVTVEQLLSGCEGHFSGRRSSVPMLNTRRCFRGVPWPELLDLSFQGLELPATLVEHKRKVCSQREWGRMRASSARVLSSSM